MSTKKIIILSMLLSLIGHALLISAAGFLARRHELPDTETAIMVSLQAAPAIRTREKKQEPRVRKAVAASPEEAMTGDVPDEETVDLDSQDERFVPYLLKLKLKIGYQWRSFPDQKNQGVTKILFSLDNAGALVASKIVASSGYKTLDRETLEVIKAAAPYMPFPQDINLSRLNITATFRYDRAP